GSGRQLWLVSAADGGGRPLTADPFLDHSAVAWSPDGSRLAFMRRPLAGAMEPPSIWMLDLPDGRPHLVVENGFMPAWLP
ncbi:MAG TPA: hypothetical protein VLA15_02310, partial [Desulfurivibrionaceae bacterium]|nr:hypothetical protein [Desulfurivibrionaceae bacterium]